MATDIQAKWRELVATYFNGDEVAAVRWVDENSAIGKELAASKERWAVRYKQEDRKQYDALYADIYKALEKHQVAERMLQRVRGTAKEQGQPESELKGPAEWNPWRLWGKSKKG